MLYVGLGIIYLLLMVFLGVRTFKNGHWILFIIGFVIPVVWIVGGMLPPKGMSRMDELYERHDRVS